jgi:serine protease Do
MSTESGNSPFMVLVAGAMGMILAFPLAASRLTSDPLNNYGATNTASAKESADLGLEVRPFTPEIARQLGQDRPQEVVVVGVQPSGTAAKAGVRPDDIIVSIGDHPIRTIKELQAAVENSDHERGVCLQLRSHGILRFVMLKAD